MADLHDHPAILAEILANYRLAPDGPHGVRHWARVLENGLRIAAATGADLDVARLFAVFHDARRENDGDDPGHGRRGAEFARSLRGRLVHLDDARFALLHAACTLHTDGLVSGDPTLLACWDADRLDLGRVGIRPDRRRVATAEGRALIPWAHSRSTRDHAPGDVLIAWGLRERPPRDPRVDALIAEEFELVPYDPDWPAAFERERQHLLACLPHDLVGRIEHFGSTAVPGLAAKPIIDVLVEVRDLEEVQRRVVPLLIAQGYEYLWRPTHGDDGLPFYAWFIRRDPVTGVRTHHLHMVESHFDQHWERLLLRDFLIACPSVAREYEDLKRRLAVASRRDRVAYAQGKSEFIESAMERARRMFAPPPEPD